MRQALFRLRCRGRVTRQEEPPMNAAGTFEYELLAALFEQFPLTLVYVGAIVVAVIRWRRHPRASAFALAGAIILLMAAVFELYIAFVTLVDDDALILEFALMWARPLVLAFGTALLVTAIFIGRNMPVPPGFGDDV